MYSNINIVLNNKIRKTYKENIILLPKINQEKYRKILIKMISTYNKNEMNINSFYNLVNYRYEELKVYFYK